jgi:hypothetical protein
MFMNNDNVFLMDLYLVRSLFFPLIGREMNTNNCRKFKKFRGKAQRALKSTKTDTMSTRSTNIVTKTKTRTKRKKKAGIVIPVLNNQRNTMKRLKIFSLLHLHRLG